jgi:hypothetical protein
MPERDQYSPKGKDAEESNEIDQQTGVVGTWILGHGSSLQEIRERRLGLFPEQGRRFAM